MSSLKTFLAMLLLSALGAFWFVLIATLPALNAILIFLAPFGFFACAMWALEYKARTMGAVDFVKKIMQYLPESEPGSETDNAPEMLDALDNLREAFKPEQRDDS